MFDKTGTRKGRDGSLRKYKELFRGKAKIENIIRIESKADRNSIANKAFDLSKKSIELLIDNGRNDAEAVLRSRSHKSE